MASGWPKGAAQSTRWRLAICCAACGDYSCSIPDRCRTWPLKGINRKAALMWHPACQHGTHQHASLAHLCSSFQLVSLVSSLPLPLLHQSLNQFALSSPACLAGDVAVVFLHCISICCANVCSLPTRPPVVPCFPLYISTFYARGSFILGGKRGVRLLSPTERR